MPKATPTKLLEMLSALGVQGVELVDNDADVDLNQDEVLQAVDASRRKILEPQIIQEQTEKLKGEIAGKNGGAFRSMLVRNFGIERKELENLNDEEMLKKALAHHDGKYSKDTEELRTELQSMMEKHNGNLAKVKEEYEGKLAEAQQRYIDRDIDEALMNVLKDAPLPKNANKLALAKQLKAAIREDAHLHFDEAKKEILLRKKDNKEMPILNEKGTVEITPFDKAKDFFTNLGIWQTDTSGVNPVDEMGKARTQDYGKTNTQPNAQVDPITAKNNAMMDYINKSQAQV